jgi:2-hydroxy-6-oxonona-2,4-dienedioate hydrolase
MTRILFIAILLSAGLLAQVPAKKSVEVMGQKIQYLEAGAASNPTVVLLHGLGGDSTNWAASIGAIAQQYHVLALDQIGFGDSGKPALNYRVGTLVDFLHGFLKKTGVTKATLVGNSLGGWTAINYTLAHPNQVDRLVLVDSGGYSPARLNGPPISRERIRLLNSSTIEGAKLVLETVLYNKMLVNDMSAEMLLVEHMRKGDSPTINAFIESVLANEDIVDGKLGAIKAPTLIVWGKQDALIPLAAGEAMAQDITGSKLVVLDKCGHVPMMECSQAFNKALLGFLSAQPEGTK